MSYPLFPNLRNHTQTLLFYPMISNQITIVISNAPLTPSDMNETCPPVSSGSATGPRRNTDTGLQGIKATIKFSYTTLTLCTQGYRHFSNLSLKENLLQRFCCKATSFLCIIDKNLG